MSHKKSSAANRQGIQKGKLTGSTPAPKSIPNGYAAKALVCKVRGHLPPTVAWYCPGPWCCSHDCRRCGQPVKPIIDPSGHP